ncbi:hypothetical protein VOLCADRAFT_90028 [Volvox carteri f. nagariensis]|uniref:TatD related DNase n=1 Tax=Volvox carteri f. nagariensis TaxID=3068 RepID=D8TTA9_VOLCA|nr:uncharacterized protein VOLCADRAFT_90028 [Volvox carteri f. nagariensis]EFJ49275.1 hypothetical protein VOLCADRAFT_90028 [Volvox carteri f. nagariensis]|eukprot:XP_002949723.1 hypothetical protein VOLCADRAFT_90028 [Volvox carteri f. nagariensis]
MEDDDLLVSFGVSDAHCHPQDDPVACASGLAAVSKCRYLAAMGTRLEDWEAVEELAVREPDKVIPCFGVHPWFAHLHALDQAAAAPADPSLPAPLPLLLDCPANGKDHPSRHPDLMPRLAPLPPATWFPRLRALLERYPQAVVGEFGLDRVAVVPGTRLQPSWSHQLALTELHLRLASELGRPASLHCVQGYGHLQDMMRRLGPEGFPPKVMLHSYGGSVDLIRGFTKLPGGVGERVYFRRVDCLPPTRRFLKSTLHARAPTPTPTPTRCLPAAVSPPSSMAELATKLLERLRAAPLERLLVESDQCSPRRVDSGLRDILEAVAEARGISLEQAAAATSENFRTFYATSLERMGRGEGKGERR